MGMRNSTEPGKIKEHKMKNAFIRLRFGMLFFFTALFLLQPGISQSFPDLPDNNLAYPVLLISKGVCSGSGFFYVKDKIVYLVTARHILFKETSVSVPKTFILPTPLRHKCFWEKDKKKEFLLKFSGVMLESERDELIKATPKSNHLSYIKAINQLYKESQNLKLRSNEITLFSNVHKSLGGIVNEFEVQLTRLFKSGHVKYHPTHDVAFIRIAILKGVAPQYQIEGLKGITKKQGNGLIGVGEENVKLLNDVIVGNQVFVFGYPTSITGINPWLNIKLPLLRKGIIAGKNEVLKAIILDCPVFAGNSGGLVIEVEKKPFSSPKYMAIGLITNFIPFQIEWYQNSGYSIVVPMDFVEELITGQTK
jgi:hypothetical protein